MLFFFFFSISLLLTACAELFRKKAATRYNGNNTWCARTGVCMCKNTFGFCTGKRCCTRGNLHLQLAWVDSDDAGCSTGLCDKATQLVGVIKPPSWWMALAPLARPNPHSPHALQQQAVRRDNAGTIINTGCTANTSLQSIDSLKRTSHGNS